MLPKGCGRIKESDLFVHYKQFSTQNKRKQKYELFQTTSGVLLWMSYRVNTLADIESKDYQSKVSSILQNSY